MSSFTALPPWRPRPRPPLRTTRSMPSQDLQGELEPHTPWGQNSRQKRPAYPHALKLEAKFSSFIVSPWQRLKFMCHVPGEFGHMVPDYTLGQSTCALFLSHCHCHYNSLPPRLQPWVSAEPGKSPTLWVLLTHVDVKDPQPPWGSCWSVFPGRLHPGPCLEPGRGRAVPGDLQGLRAEAGRPPDGEPGVTLHVPRNWMSFHHEFIPQHRQSDPPGCFWVSGTAHSCIMGRPCLVPRPGTPEAPWAVWMSHMRPPWKCPDDLRCQWCPLCNNKAFSCPPPPAPRKQTHSIGIVDSHPGSATHCVTVVDLLFHFPSVGFLLTKMGKNFWGYL